MQDKIQYVGPQEVTGVVIQDYKTPSGKEVVKVLFTNPEKCPPWIMPIRTFELLVSEIPHDWNWVHETKFKVLHEELAAVCMEHDIMHGEIKSVGDGLAKKLEASFDRATNFLWTGDDKQFIPGGIGPVTERNILECDIILKKIRNEQSTDEGSK